MSQTWEVNWKVAWDNYLENYHIPVGHPGLFRLLEENDGAGNTFKATAKPVLIGTAVVGGMVAATVMSLLFTPVFYVVMQKISGFRKKKPETGLTAEKEAV